MDYKREVLVEPRVKTTTLRPKVHQTHLEKRICEEAGAKVLKLVSSYININHPNTQVFSTSTAFNISKLERKHINAVVNLKRINDIRRINKFFETINENLTTGSTFIGCVETLELRKKRLMNKFPALLNRLYVFGDYVFKRVFPKLPVTKQFYFTFTGGRNRIISRAETLGRLYSCGFEVIHEETHGYLFYFVVKKVKAPAYDLSPSYGPVFGMSRIGKNGKTIKVYKLRTMYPYSEYLQQYIYEKNKLEDGGKFKNDFRITDFGGIMRKFWLDELPMLYNLLKFELKIVGVRPLSKHYLSLYPEELVELRKKFRPGLVPPYYADMPKSFDEIIESESKYLQAYRKNPLITDIRYFVKAFVNIVFKNARSK